MINRFCLWALFCCFCSVTGTAQLPLDTGIKILSPRFFPGWQDQHVGYPFVLYDKAACQYKMYYAGSSSTQVNESLWDQWVTGMVTSSNTLDWTYPDNYEQILFARKLMEGDAVNPDEQEKTFDAVYAVDACVVKDGAGYKCWYTGWSGQLQPLDNGVSKKIDFRIGYAISADGINWKKQKGIAGAGAVVGIGAKGAADACGVEDPYVIKEKGAYRMWYVGFDGATRRIQYATSPDGINWTKKGAAPGIGSGTVNPVVITRAGQYELWYQKRDGSLWQVKRATSKDGISWKPAGEVLLHPAVPNPRWPWTAVSPDMQGKTTLGNIIVQPDNSCQVFYGKQFTASKAATYGTIQTPLSFIYTERINP